MRNFIVAIMLSSLFLVAACQTTVSGPNPLVSVDQRKSDTTVGDVPLVFEPEQDLAARSFSSEEELDAFLLANGGSSSYNGWGLTRMAVDRDFAMEDSMALDAVAPMAAQKLGGGDDGGLDYSGTNNQVASVDEGDIIKTDGEFIYTVTDSTLFIIKAYPGEDAEVVSKLSFEEGRPSGLFIDDDRLVVFGTVSNYDFFDKWEFTPRTGMSFVKVFNVSDRENLELVKEFSFEGSYFDSRMMDGYAYILVRSYPNRGPYPPMPIVVEDGVRSSVPVENIRFFPYRYDSAQFVTVHAIDLDSLDLDSLTVTVESSQEVYMSEHNLYISYTKYINEWDFRQAITIETVEPLLGRLDARLMDKIRATDDEVLSPAEKDSKMYAIVSTYMGYLSSDEQENLSEEIDGKVKDAMEKYDYYEYTVINKVSVDHANMDVVASGRVPGHVVNQFSLDEYNGVLRVATTVNARWSSWDSSRSESTNHVFTLDGDLEVLDSVDDIAEGERVYSTRFMDDRLYMVTFRQVDPFFVFDLSDPEDIQELGQLKIPGFSRYLHPYNEDVIIGIGRDATDSGRQQGLKISLFNVSDPENPVEIAKYVNSNRYSQSGAEYEHKAFLFSKEKNLLVVPVYSYDWRDKDGYNGALVFDISEDAIEARGLIDHSKGITSGWYGPQVERSLFIEDLLYTKSPYLLRINDLDSLEGVKDISLSSSVSGDIPVY